MPRPGSWRCPCCRRAAQYLSRFANGDKDAIVPVRAAAPQPAGFEIIATQGTYDALRKNDVPATRIAKLSEGRPNIADFIKNKKVQLLINTPTRKGPHTDEGRIRAMAVLAKVPIVTDDAGQRRHENDHTCCSRRGGGVFGGWGWWGGGDWGVQPLPRSFFLAKWAVFLSTYGESRCTRPTYDTSAVSIGNEDISMNLKTAHVSLLLCASIFVTGCLITGDNHESTSGTRVADTTFDQIKPKSTTEDWVRVTLGPPTSDSILQDGGHVLKYVYTERKESILRGLPDLWRAR